MPFQLVIDTNVLISALRSNRGASFKLLSLIGVSDQFEVNLSIPLVLEYEDVAKRKSSEIDLSAQDIDHIIDYICSTAGHHQIFFLWRPFLSDPKDDMVLELAVVAQCDYIITYNKRDFVGVDKFGLRVLSPLEFLQLIGEIQ